MNIKRLLSLLGLVLCLVLCAVPVFADEEVTELPDTPATSTADTGVRSIPKTPGIPRST